MSVSTIKEPNPRTGYFYKTYASTDNTAKALVEYLISNNIIVATTGHTPFFVTLMHGSMWWFAGAIYSQSSGDIYGSCICGTYNHVYKVLINQGVATGTEL